MKESFELLTHAAASLPPSLLPVRLLLNVGSEEEIDLLDPEKEGVGERRVYWLLTVPPTEHRSSPPRLLSLSPFLRLNLLLRRCQSQRRLFFLLTARQHSLERSLEDSREAEKKTLRRRRRRRRQKEARKEETREEGERESLPEIPKTRFA